MKKQLGQGVGSHGKRKSGSGPLPKELIEQAEALPLNPAVEFLLSVHDLVIHHPRLQRECRHIEELAGAWDLLKESLTRKRYPRIVRS